MKKTALALALTLTIFSIIVVTQKDSLVKANFNFFKSRYCDILMHSPQHLMIYDTDHILLNFTVETNYYVPADYERFSYCYFYSLDEQDAQSSVKIEKVHIVSQEEITNEIILPYTHTILRGLAELSGLLNGPHSIKIFAGYLFNNGTIADVNLNPSSATVWFSVGNTDASSESSSISEPTFVSPQNKTYNSNQLVLNASACWFIASIKSMSYSVDGKRSIWLTLEKPESESFNHMNGTVIGAVALSELAEGPHSITVQVKGTRYFPEKIDIIKQTTTNFTIDVTPPIISELSVENKTYNQLDLSLNLTVNEPTSWMGYSLDNEANVTLTGNTTLTFKEGLHNIVVYANDTAGNLATSETIYFTIEQVFPTMPVAAGVASTTLVGIGLLVYFKKRRQS